MGSGYSKIAPGTVGSLVAAFSWPVWLMLAPSVQWLLWIIVFVFSNYCCHVALNAEGNSVGMVNKKDKAHDPSWIVIDEACAVFLIPLCLHVSEFNDYHWITAFLLFRILDIFKPWPIYIVERFRPAALAVMLDDIVAVLLAILIMRLYLYC